MSDFLIFLWPIKDIPSVRISRRQRITLISMLSCGIMYVAELILPSFSKLVLIDVSVCVAGSARIYYTHLYLYSYDVLWWGATVFAVMSVETCIGIVCGCLPGCKPLMSRVFPQFFGTATNGSDRRPRNRGAIKEIMSSGASGILESTQPSFQLQGLNSGGEGIIVSSDPQGVQQNTRQDRYVRIEIPRRPIPVFHKADHVDDWRSGPDGVFGGDDSDSNESQDIVILQRQSTKLLNDIDVESGESRYSSAKYSGNKNRHWR